MEMDLYQSLQIHKVKSRFCLQGLQKRSYPEKEKEKLGPLCLWLYQKTLLATISLIMTDAKRCFSVSNSEGLHKGYDRFQSLLSQLEVHGAGVSTEDANQKFLRSLPSAWSQVSLIMRTKPGMVEVSALMITGHFARECRTKGNQDSKRRNDWNSGNKDGKRSSKQEDSKALVTINGESVDWTSHSKEEEDYALMACNSSDTKVTSCSKECKESYAKLKKLHDEQRAQLSDVSIEIQAYIQGLKKVEAQLVTYQQAVLTRTGKIPVSTARASVSAVGGRRETAVKPSAGCNWRPKRHYWHKISKYNGGTRDYPVIRALQNNDEIVDKLQHFNLFSVSQIYDKKNKVLFTDSDCLVLSPEFKLPGANQVLLRIPRQNNMYSFNLENIVPSRGLACLIAKATIDESNKWNRRLGHVNFKNLNKLVKGNLVRGLPSKIFQNDHTCVACQKGKQHKASCKAKSVSSISHSLQLLHMDLFGPTSVRSLNHKTYCLVITDDFSRNLRIGILLNSGVQKDKEGNIVCRIPQQNGVLERKNRGPL
ncbi:putative ribonuclease H-like domain-containing protein [Tanacetum coccineum]